MDESTQPPRSFSLWCVFREASKLTNRSLIIFWPIFLLIILLDMSLHFYYGDPNSYYPTNLFFIHINWFIPASLPVIAKLSIEQARQHKISLTLILKTFVTRFPSMWVVWMFTAIIALFPTPVFIGMLVSHPPAAMAYIIFGIAFVYILTVFIYLSLGQLFIVDKTFNPFVALEHSFALVKGNFLKMAIVTLLWIAMLFMVFQLPSVLHSMNTTMDSSNIITMIYLLGVIWVIPFLGLCYGRMYCKLVD